jgi:hypothetical protein
MTMPGDPLDPDGRADRDCITYQMWQDRHGGPVPRWTIRLEVESTLPLPHDVVAAGVRNAVARCEDLAGSLDRIYRTATPPAEGGTVTPVSQEPPGSQP